MHCLFANLSAQRHPRAQVALRSIRGDLRTERSDAPDLAVGRVLAGALRRFPARHQFVPDCDDPDEAAPPSTGGTRGKAGQSRLFTPITPISLWRGPVCATAAPGTATSRACPAAHDFDEVGSYLAECRT